MKPIRLNWPDSCRAEIYQDGTWDLVFPPGRHLRGKEANTAFAQAAVEAAHNDWILAQWAKGSPARQQYVVPLT